ncbi:alpha/beta hydrolase family esterase [Noviherbaspirillum sp. ST9]|uniref:extracellular catalytic domain type 1 short-chain-length polyhydroxyalkanoate depolymerase n=1 Tax=Noviherbaspirillum sp. ST9 TaxID=3401606 RepID=UPI003B588659
MKINDGFLAQMREATQLLQTEGPMAATAAIQRALHGASPDATSPQHADWTAFLPQAPAMPDLNPQQTGADVLARFAKLAPGAWSGAAARQRVEDVEAHEVPASSNAHAPKGRFIAGSFTNSAGTRAYKLYIPSGYKDEPLPLVVMLHGCTQNPDDFAAGTGMNNAAEEENCFVVYPEQTKNANGSQCWNWFQPGDQRRDHGEPSILAGIARDVAGKYKIDSSRVYVAGLSAGGAMAVVLAATYPEVFAAVGIHSGLPYAVAHDVPSAFASMKRRKLKPGAQQPAPLGKMVPAIVFHGDRDATVAPLNGDQALAQCVPIASDPGTRADVKKETAPGGRSYTKTVIHDSQGQIVAEKWVVHGAAHAWSGGSRKGSYTDPKGPDASREMLRFFLAQRRPIS